MVSTDPQVQKEVLEKRRLEKKTTMDSLKKYKKGQSGILKHKDLEDCAVFMYTWLGHMLTGFCLAGGIYSSMS